MSDVALLRCSSSFGGCRCCGRGWHCRASGAGVVEGPGLGRAPAAGRMRG